MTTETVESVSTEPVLTLSEEQEDLATALRQWLHSSWQPRTLIDGEHLTGPAARALWRDVDAAVGLAEVTIPETYAGAGGGTVELSVIAETIGGGLFPAPWLGTLGLAVPALCSGEGNAARAAMLESVATAAQPLALAWSGSDVVCARDDSGAVTVSGLFGAVIDAPAADSVLVVAPLDGQQRLLAVDLRVPGVDRTDLATLDLARTHADIELDAAPALDLGAIAGSELEHALDVARVSAAAELVGVAARSLDLAVEYAKQRTQFGRLIGTFQAVKHRCARMLIEVEQARSVLRFAAWCADNAEDELAVAAREAYWLCGRVAVQVTADLIRVLGGIGFTWEHDAHLYFRRARATAMLLGDPLSCVDELAGRLLP